MGWEQLEKIEIGGNIYVLGQLSQTAFAWVTTHSNDKTSYSSNPTIVSTATYPFLYTESRNVSVDISLQLDSLNRLNFYSTTSWYSYLFYQQRANEQAQWATGITSRPYGRKDGAEYNIFGIIINHEIHQANLWCVNIDYDSRYYLSAPSVGSSQTLVNFYNAIVGHIPQTYQWSSVPSISGKNGSLSLPTLVDTDGEPISGQSASVFSSLPEGSNVRALINGAL